MTTLVYAKIVDMSVKPSNIKEWANFLQDNEGKDVQIKRTTYTRTDAQNNALHKYFELLANEMSKAGYQFHMKLGSKDVKLDWSPSLVKEAMWKPIQRSLLNKSSTTELNKTEDINTVYDHINRFVSEELHIHIPFPTEEKDDRPMPKADVDSDELLKAQVF